MNPPSNDNYGCDYCSLLCLPTTPVTIALATTKGIIYHCLVIVGNKNEEEMVCQTMLSLLLSSAPLTFFRVSGKSGSSLFAMRMRNLFMHIVTNTNNQPPIVFICLACYMYYFIIIKI